MILQWGLTLISCEYPHHSFNFYYYYKNVNLIIQSEALYIGFRVNWLTIPFTIKTRTKPE